MHADAHLEPCDATLSAVSSRIIESMRSLRRVTRIALGVFVLFGGLVSAQNADIKWPKRVTFSASDKREIIALAKLMGVESPASVGANVRDDCCRIVFVTSQIIENGKERSWMDASMIRDNWREYAARSQKNGLRVGHWIADDSPPQHWSEWRIRDGSWFVDVARGKDRPSVSYHDAELIVLALHNGNVVNKIPERAYNGERYQPSIPKLKEGFEYTLSHFREESASEYMMSFGGTMLGLRIVGDSVEALWTSTVEY